MADIAESNYYDQEEQNQEAEENEKASSMKQDSLFLYELNLVMIIASLGLSNQELSELEEMEKLNNDKQQQDTNDCVCKLNPRKRGFDQLKVPNRQASLSTSRSQSKVLDFRHGRKV